MRDDVRTIQKPTDRERSGEEKESELRWKGKVGEI